MNLKDKKVLVTGASFIGSHLVSVLIKKKVRSIHVVNRTNRFKHVITNISNFIDFSSYDLRNVNHALAVTKNVDLVFHLACDHGGRAYISEQQGAMASNGLLDGAVFYASLKNSVQRVFYASSACVYPITLQDSLTKSRLLKESEVGPPYFPDTMYGWAKLTGERTLQNYFNQYGLKSTICRLFSVYGEYSSDSHAVTALIKKALKKQDPFEVWGDGRQRRNWTYVADIVNGILSAVEQLKQPKILNLGSDISYSISETVQLILDQAKFKPRAIRHLNMPVGPVIRAADYSLARSLLQWYPKYSLRDGLKKTIDWYRENLK